MYSSHKYYTHTVHKDHEYQTHIGLLGISDRYSYLLNKKTHFYWVGISLPSITGHALKQTCKKKAQPRLRENGSNG